MVQCTGHFGDRLALFRSMRSQTRFVEGSKFETRIGAHYVVSDQPVSNGGLDAGVTAPELLLAALGSCAGHHALEYLRTRGLPVTGLSVEVSAEELANPARMEMFHVKVHADKASETDREGLFEAVHQCLISNTLMSMPAVQVEIDTAAPIDSVSA
jgi:putative redox protein